MTGLLLLAAVLATTAAFRLAGLCLLLLRESVGSSPTSSSVFLEIGCVDELTSSLLKRVALLERPEGFVCALGSWARGLRLDAIPVDGSLAAKRPGRIFDPLS